MKIQVIINGCVAHEEPVSSYGVERIAQVLGQAFKLELLKQCGIEAFMILEGVESKMNYAWFETTPTPWDETHFGEIEDQLFS